VEAMVALAEGDLQAARRLARESRNAYAGTDSVLAGDLSAYVSTLLRDGGELAADRAWLGERSGYGARLERSLRVHEAAAFALEGRVSEAAHAYRRVIDDLRAADLRLDLGLTLVQRAWLLGPDDTEAAAGLQEARAVFAAMGAETFIDRLTAGAGRAAHDTAADQAAERKRQDAAERVPG
jgi:hypothetical protein